MTQAKTIEHDLAKSVEAKQAVYDAAVIENYGKYAVTRLKKDPAVIKRVNDLFYIPR